MLITQIGHIDMNETIQLKGTHQTTNGKEGYDIGLTIWLYPSSCSHHIRVSLPLAGVDCHRSPETWISRN